MLRRSRVARSGKGGGEGSAQEDSIRRTNVSTRQQGAAAARRPIIARHQPQTLRQQVMQRLVFGGGEIDLVMRDRDGTLVFVEVRQRGTARYGGAAGSIGVGKQRRIVFAARHFLLRLGQLPPCRFDVVSIEGGGIQWMRAAFEAS
ncbi:MAG: YraN family protein [Comamonadaceae bacterium]|nr:MAG: YraN family protein [Comamonadaceae bacterium]